jgi:hypothetical protein
MRVYLTRVIEISSYTSVASVSRNFYHECEITLVSEHPMVEPFSHIPHTIHLLTVFHIIVLCFEVTMPNYLPESKVIVLDPKWHSAFHLPLSEMYQWLVGNKTLLLLLRKV